MGRNGKDHSRSGATKIQRDLERHQPSFTSFDRSVEEFCRERNEWKNKEEDSLPPYLCRVDDELAGNVERLARVGNGQVPSVAALAFKTLSGK